MIQNYQLLQKQMTKANNLYNKSNDLQTEKEKEKEQQDREKRINKKATFLYERAIEEYNTLIRKKKILLSEKKKIFLFTEELDAKKKQYIKKAWNKINKSLASIFNTLLPGASAKLVEPEGLTYMNGLEVKVALGGKWKHSLTELSGGQKSLLALAFIFALLQFKPAPIYILDEIDAALDSNHTQNIGIMIRKHFPKSQFIVVSLKEGLFNHANVLFRTEFVNKLSVITRVEPNDS